MARVIRKAAAWRATLVLQANEAIDNLPAQSAILRRLMEENGYPAVHTHAFAGLRARCWSGESPADDGSEHGRISPRSGRPCG